MPMEFAHCVSAVCCSDPQEKNKQSFHRTTVEGFAPQTWPWTGVCVLHFHPEHFLGCSEGASNPAFLQFEDNQRCSSSR